MLNDWYLLSVPQKFITARSHIYKATKQMRKFPLGQDRFTRQYWNLPAVGGILVEGVETAYNEYLDKLLDRIGWQQQRGGGRARKMVRGEYVVAATDNHSLGKELTPFGDREGSASVITSSHEPSPATPFRPTPQSTDQEMDMDVASSSNQPAYDSPEKSSQHHLALVEDTPTKDQLTTPNYFPMQKSNEQLATTSRVAQPHTNSETLDDAVQPHSETSLHLHPSSTLTATSSSTSSSSNTAVTAMDQTMASSSSSSNNKSTPSLISQPTEHNWFSILPRKPCEILHYLQADGTALLNSQQQALMVAPQYVMATAGGGYAYVTPGGAVIGQPLVQQVQVGYTLVGNTLVPQTQYIVGQNPLAVGGQQYMTVANGQVALANTGTAVQYVTIGGNQYAILQTPSQQVVEKEEEEEGTSGGGNAVSSAETVEEEEVKEEASQVETPAAPVESAQASPSRAEHSQSVAPEDTTSAAGTSGEQTVQ